jgi:uncharacterized glyoxalase superfamily protein PhnB
MFDTITTNIMVENVEKTMNFYCSMLGFESILTVPSEGDIFDFAILKKDNISIMLQSKESLVEEYPTLNTDKIVPSFTLYITVKDIDKLYKEITNKNVKLAKEMHKTFYGKKEFAIFDNNSNILTIAE